MRKRLKANITLYNNPLSERSSNACRLAHILYHDYDYNISEFFDNLRPCVKCSERFCVNCLIDLYSIKVK